MKCPLCNDDVDRNLAEMETHLKEVHELDENDLEQFGNDFSDIVQPQIDLEIQEKILYRISVARMAITRIREDKRYWPTPKSMERALTGITTWQTWPLSYGFYGLLDYMETGELQKIKDPTLRRTVKSVLASDRNTQE